MIMDKKIIDKRVSNMVKFNKSHDSYFAVCKFAAIQYMIEKIKKGERVDPTDEKDRRLFIKMICAIQDDYAAFLDTDEGDIWEIWDLVE